MTQVDVKGTKLDMEANFFYPGYMLYSGGGCDSTIAARCCVALGKLRKLLPVLTFRHPSPEMPGKVYAACVHSAMFHSSETWGPNTLVLKWLHCNDRAMICWIGDTKVRDETPSASLLKNLGNKDIMAVLCYGQLRYGYVQRATSCIKSVTELTLPGPRGKGRPRKTWWMCQDWY